MADQSIKNLRGPARRNFLRWIGAAGAAVALERSKLLNFIWDQGGDAMAQEASCSLTNRSVHIVGGNGSFSWFQLLWPHIEIAEAGNPDFAYHAPGAGYRYTGGDRDFFYGPEAPWQSGNQPMPGYEVTGFMTGANETHTQTPVTSATVASNASMLATVASIQRADPSLLPVIGVGPVNLGAAPGSPSIATVPSAQGMVELFNSAASQLTLAATEDQQLYETYYKAIVGLRKAADLPTWKRHLDVTKTAANLLGRNLAGLLAPTQADLDDYGVTALAASQASDSAKQRLTNLARALISTARSFELGLTNSVIIALAPGATSDNQFTDPHAAFNNMGSLNDTILALGTILNAFYADLAATPDQACSGENLDKSVVFTAHGDTPKTPLQRDAWPDSTPGNSNWMYAMGAGHLRTGWYGGVRANGNIDGFDPATGQLVAGQSASVTSTAAGAAVAYAVAKGDIDRVDTFSPPDISGIIK